MGMMLLRNIVLIILATGLYSCAKQGTPSGGPKDMEPPVPVESNPGNYSTNVKPNKITITFDEYIQQGGFASQVLISPPLEEAPEFLVKGKSLQIKLNNELDSATTYNINFGNSIKDLNEGNPLSNFNFAFSTGSALDSGMISGYVFDTYSQEPEADVLVGLYLKDKDSIPYKEIPYYISKSDKTGKFYFQNIKNADFKIFALSDANNNMIFDMPNEKIGFLDTLIQPEFASEPDTAFVDSMSIKEEKEGLKLYLFNEETYKRYITDNIRHDSVKCSVILNKPDTVTPIVQAISPKNIDFIQQLSINNDTVILWIKNENHYKLDTLLFAVSYFGYDSLANTISVTDTLSFYEKKTKKQKKKFLKPLVKGNLDLNRNISFSCQAPINMVDTSLVFLYMVEDSIYTPENYLIKTDSLRNNLLFVNKLKPNTNYEIQLLPGAVRDIYNYSNDTITLKYKTPELDTYGKIILNISDSTSTPVIIELLDSKRNIKSTIYTNKSVVHTFEFLKPGQYNLRIIFDDDNNKKWTTGNYLNNKQPEKVLYFKSEIKVRANWDLELDFNVDDFVK